MVSLAETVVFAWAAGAGCSPFGRACACGALGPSLAAVCWVSLGVLVLPILQAPGEINQSRFGRFFANGVNTLHLAAFKNGAGGGVAVGRVRG